MNRPSRKSPSPIPNMLLTAERQWPRWNISKVYDQVKDKLVLGENISQAAQFVESGAADVGIIALSLALATADEGSGTVLGDSCRCASTDRTRCCDSEGS